MAEDQEVKDLLYTIDKINKVYTDIKELEQHGGSESQLRASTVELRELLLTFATHLAAIIVKQQDARALLQLFADDIKQVHTIINTILTNPISDMIVQFMASYLNQKLSSLVVTLNFLKSALRK